MSHAEIWDDSALVNSWNEALDEYKRYHSIHARGEKVEDILRPLENKESASEHSAEEPAHQEEPEITSGMNLDINYGQGMARGANRTSTQGPQSENKLSPAEQALGMKPSHSSGSQSSRAAIPQHLVGSVQDEGLKNLLMSWYYAGYYTGLHEGQQQGR